MDLDKIRQKIWAFESLPYKLLNGVSVEVKNIRIRKREGIVLADIYINYLEDKRTEIYWDCEYPLEKSS